MARRVVLLSLQNETPFRHFRDELFPFLQGWLREHGTPAEWLVMPVPPSHVHAGGRFVVDLPPERREILLGALAELTPEILICNDQPAEPLRACLADACPGARLVPVPGSKLVESSVRLGWLSGVFPELPFPAEGAPGAEECLLDAANPDYRRRPLLPIPTRDGVQPVRLAGGAQCLYHRALGDNPFFAGLPDAMREAHRGCAFCAIHHPGSLEHPFRTPTIDLALKQVRAHQQANPHPTGPHHYHVEDARVAVHLDRFLTRVLEDGLAPSAFHVYLRADEFLALRPRLERVLPDLRAAGHRVSILSMGAENFSPDENLRLNKGLEPAQALRALDQLEELERRFPTAFAFRDNGFSAILFTPWTNLADLRLNFHAARRLGPRWLSYFLGTRLQVRRGGVLAERASQDGLLCEAWPDDSSQDPVCLVNPSDQELPWRFQDGLTARAHSLLVRLEPVSPQVTLAQADELHRALNLGRTRLPPALDRDPFGLCLALVDAVEALGPQATPQAALEWAAEHAPLYVVPPPAFSLGYADALLASRALHAALTRSGALPPGLSLAGARAEPYREAWCVVLALETPESLALRLSALRPGHHPWVSGERLEASFERSQRAPSPGAARLATRLVHLAEKALAGRWG
jgi:hypothetical protein